MFIIKLAQSLPARYEHSISFVTLMLRWHGTLMLTNQPARMHARMVKSQAAWTAAAELFRLAEIDSLVSSEVDE